MLLANYITELMFLVGTCFTKISIFLFYRRLLSSLCHSKMLLRILWANIIFTITYTFIFVVLLFSSCHPISALWQHFAPGYSRQFHCIDTSIAELISSAFSAVSDLLAIVLPLSFLLTVQVPLRERLAICSVFLVGIS
jgi:hypothetical protein